MDAERRAVLRKMLEMGFQVEAAVLDVLLKDRSADEALNLLAEIAKRKRLAGASRIITRNDLDIGHGEERHGVPSRRLQLVYDVEYDPWTSMRIAGDAYGYNTLLKSRFQKFDGILRNRVESREIRKISSLRRLSSSNMSKVTVRGLVRDKRIVDGRLVLEIEDESGTLTVVGQNGVELYDDIVLDEMIIVEIRASEKGFVVDNYHHLDIPDVRRRESDDIWVAFLSDIHFGSPDFDERAFSRFIRWVKGELGEEDVVSRVKYIVIVGDVIDRTSLFDGGKESFREAYTRFSTYLNDVGSDIVIFIVPGESDATVDVLPQPPILRSVAAPLYERKNSVLLGNPSFLALNGVKILAYHGQGISDIRGQISGSLGVSSVDLMKRLVRARHLAPTLGAHTGVFPMMEDVLVMEEIPDIFVCGHMHSSGIGGYKGMLLLSLPSWLKSEYEENRSRVALVNLSTFDVMWRG
ncbi:MAG: metallophosphoesterase [Candidatus Parvarchaeota archaeon]